MKKKTSHCTDIVAEILIVAGVLVFAGRPAASQTFNQFVGFGDSTIDSGSHRSLASPGASGAYNALWPAAVAAGAGKPTNSPGLTIGTTTTIAQGVTGYATFLTQIAQQNAVIYGGQVGLNVALP